jgi:hypothetical protein
MAAYNRRGAKRPARDEQFLTAIITIRGPEEVLTKFEQISLCEHLSEIQPIPLRLAMRNAKFAWKRHTTVLELPDRALLVLLPELSRRYPEVAFRVQVSPTLRTTSGETVSHISDVTVLQDGQEILHFENQDPDSPAWSWILNPAYDPQSEHQNRQLSVTALAAPDASLGLSGDA